MSVSIFPIGQKLTKMTWFPRLVMRKSELTALTSLKQKPLYQQLLIVAAWIGLVVLFGPIWAVGVYKLIQAIRTKCQKAGLNWLSAPNVKNRSGI
jgi:hypothetical protein